MRKIKINLSTTDKFLSKIIRFVQGLPFSHSYLEFENRYFEATLVYEAKGLSSYLINKNFQDGVTVYEFETEVTEEKYIEIMKFIYGDIGIPYAWKEMFGHVYKRICRLVKLNVKNPFPQKGKICSESCGEILVRFFGVTPDVGYDDMDLIWLFEKMKDHPDFKMIKGI